MRQHHEKISASAFQFARRVLKRLGPQPFTALVFMMVLFGGAWAFVELADDVTEQETRSIDEAALLALRNPGDAADPLGPGWVEEAARDFTALGGVGVLTLITLGATGYLLLARRRRAALFALAAVASGVLLSTLLKMGFDRPRPELVPQEVVVYTASFPSGHAMMAAITYFTLAALLSRVQPSSRLKAYLLSVAAFIVLLVGTTRVYLGVHWPTDVLAGWSAGAAWASMCWLVFRGLQRRGIVESSGRDEAGD